MPPPCHLSTIHPVYRGEDDDDDEEEEEEEDRPPLPSRPPQPSPWSSSTTLVDDIRHLKMWRDDTFDWTKSPRVIGLARKSTLGLRKGAPGKYLLGGKSHVGITFPSANRSLAADLIHVAQIPKEEEYELKAVWDFFLPNKARIPRHIIGTNFCQHVFHVSEALHNGKSLPRDIPFPVRSHLNKDYRRVKTQIKRAPGPKHIHLAKWICAFEGPEQGTLLVACLEFFIFEGDLPYCHRFFNAVTQEITQLQTLRYVDDNQMANFFATLVRTFRNGLIQSKTQENEWQMDAVNFIFKFWGYCTHLNNNPRQRSCLFQQTIEKLDVYDIVLCLWIFATIAYDIEDNGNLNSAVKLCRLMEIELSIRIVDMSKWDKDWLWVPTAAAVLGFLVRVNKGLLQTLDPLMVGYCGKQNWDFICDNADRFDDDLVFRTMVKEWRTHMRNKPG